MRWQRVALCLGASMLLAASVPAAPEDEWNIHVSTDWGFSMMEDMLGNAPVRARDFQLYGEALGLDAQQAALAGELYVEYAAELRNMSTLMTEKRADMQAQSQASQDWQLMQASFTKASAEQGERERELTEQLFADLRLVITPEQEKGWAQVERTRRRRETLAQFSIYPRERIDLVAIVQGMEMPESFRTSLGAALEAYEQELDAALVARNGKCKVAARQADEVNDLQTKAWSPAPDADPQSMMDAQQRVQAMSSELIPVALDLREASARVRDVNDRHAEALAARFPQKLRETFQSQIAKVAGKSENAVPFSDFSRAKMAMQTLEQLEAMKPMMEMQAQMFADSDMAAEMQPYLDRLKTVPPLSQAQRDELAHIRADLEAELDAAQRRHGGTSDSNEDELNSFTIRLDRVSIAMSRIDGQDDGMSMWGGAQDAKQIEQLKEQAEINQRAIDRIRALLTIEQRSVIAQF